MNFSGGVLGVGEHIGAESVAITAVWVAVTLTFLGIVTLTVFNYRLVTRAEAFCILFAVLIASPLIAQGFWRMMFSRLSAIPISADFDIYDAYPSKLWPHGPNLTEGILENSEGQPVDLSGGMSRERVEVEKGQWANIPVASNREDSEISALRFEIPVSGDGNDSIVPEQP
jgi:hypothetical protein